MTECSCGHPGLTYCGPEEDCPTHGLRCVVDASCEIGDHTRSWPCEYAPGTGALGGPDIDSADIRSDFYR